MRVVLDIEANSLTKPTKIHLIVCKDIDTGERYVFRNVTDNPKDFVDFANDITMVIGHNIIGYDLNVINLLLRPGPFESGERGSVYSTVDTLVISKLVDYSRDNGHSLAAYGEEFGLPKIEFSDWTKWSQEMEDYCVRDVDINHRLFLHLHRYITDPVWSAAIKTEHDFQIVVNNLHTNGFCFDGVRATKLLTDVTSQLAELDKEIKDAFPSRLVLEREITPKLTKHGTLHRGDFRWVHDGDLSEFNGGPFCKCSWEDFNPSSHKQLIRVLHDAEWRPTDKTKTHIELLRKKRLDKDDLDKLEHLRKYGFRVNEANLSTLPESAPKPARLLARRILLESRRRTLTEWLGLVEEDGRIHGTFQGIGAWTHRMSHQRPNMANIPSEYRIDGTTQFLGKEMRSLWRAPPRRLLAGADAEGIQLRIFAHYINDEEFTDALVRGRKEEKTDPHSLNQRVLGSVCKSRSAAKRFIYAYLLGAGIGKLSEVLGCSKAETEKALDALLQRYTGFRELKRTIIPRDGKRGYFIGLDGRRVSIPGDTEKDRAHLAMSGYLQNGEAIVVKRSVLKTLARLIEGEIPGQLVDVVHDEVVFEVPNSMRKAQAVIDCFNNSIEEVGRELKLRCPLKGEGHVGLNWWEIH